MGGSSGLLDLCPLVFSSRPQALPAPSVPQSDSPCRTLDFPVAGCGPFLHTMIPRSLLVFLFLLGGLEEALSQRGLCADDRCFALFLGPEDWSGARDSCRDSGGHLVSSAPPQTLTTLLSGVNGSFWLHNCSAVSALTGLDPTFTQQPCAAKLSGFLCQVPFDEPCSLVPSGGDTQVQYTTPEGFTVTGSEVFPPGTIAVVQQVGATHLQSRHVCFSRKWMAAPWSCEVFGGGCDHGCNNVTHTCMCPVGQKLHPNAISCTRDPCADCAQRCSQQGALHLCGCDPGYRLAPDGKSCTDVNECVEENPCTAEGEECVNTPGTFHCRCIQGFEEEDGVCVNVSICEKCEHMKCEKFNGVYECLCHKGFRVSAHDPTRCELHCTDRECRAFCVPNPDVQRENMHQCFCPEGYIQDVHNKTPICTDIDECKTEPCDHRCENLFGGYRCVCDKGFEPQDDGACVAADEDEDASGSTPTPSTPASVQPATVPQYIHTGSVLGITVFMLLCLALVCFVIRSLSRRCGKLELSSLKRPDMDIFYLQQVTTETYKRLSLDKQFKNDSQRL